MVLIVCTKGLENVNASIDALHSGDCLRAVVQIGDSGIPTSKLPKLKVEYCVEWYSYLNEEF